MTLKNTWIWLQDHSKGIRLVFLATAALLTVGVIGYQIVDNWREIRSYNWQWDLRYLFIGFGVYSVSLILTASIWTAIIRRLSNTPHPFLTHMGLYCLTNLAMRLPTPLPYVGARTEAYASRGVPRSTTLTALSLEIITTIAGALIIALVTLPFGYSENLSHLSPYIWLLLPPLLAFLIRPNWLVKAINYLLRRFHRPALLVTLRTRDLLAWVGLYTLVWVNAGVLYYLLANSIYSIPYRDMLFIVNISAVSGLVGWVGQLLFFLPGFALRQVAAAFLLSFLVPWPVAVAIALLARLCVMVFEMAWATFFSLLYFQKIQK